MYPNTPGSKGGGASKDAAKAVTSRAEALRSNVTELMLKGYRLTADEIAKRLNESVLSMRPRVSELVKSKVLIKTSDRRKNNSGMMAHVLRHHMSEVAVELPQVEAPARRKAQVVHHDQNALFS